MPLLNVHDLSLLKNESEEVVLNELENQLNYLPGYICTCKECLLDVTALALNSIKPLYRVSLLGKIYTGVAMNENDYAAKVREAVFKAIEKVHKNPAHPLRGKNEEVKKKASNHFKQKKKTKPPNETK